jgi:hypothetical protein
MSKHVRISKASEALERSLPAQSLRGVARHASLVESPETTRSASLHAADATQALWNSTETLSTSRSKPLAARLTTEHSPF